LFFQEKTVEYGTNWKQHLERMDKFHVSLQAFKYNPNGKERIEDQPEEDGGSHKKQEAGTRDGLNMQWRRTSSWGGGGGIVIPMTQ
jgi:hypothetical protein